MNQVLYGAGAIPGIVAVELKNDRWMRLYRRDGVEDVPFTPFLWLDRPEAPGNARVEELKGTARYRWLAVYESWSEAAAAHRALDKRSHLWIPDPVQQYLTWSGETLFREMRFPELTRLQLDIETYCAPEYEFSQAEREQDRLIAIGVSSNRGHETVIWGKDLDERDMLLELDRLMREIDPDVIEGHFLCKFDLPYLTERARRHGVTFRWGRDGSAPTTRPSRINVAERVIDYPRWEVAGRHLVDTWLLVQFHDISSRDMDSYSLKDAARYFGVAAPDRTYLDGSRISWAWDHSPEQLRAYCLDDVKETRAIAGILSTSYFLQTQIFPFNYGTVVVRGNATRINALFLREYLRQRYSIPPEPENATAYEGGYTDIFAEGVQRNVVHCDVQSLYPSVMLSWKIAPRSDELGIFLPLLADLRTFRLQAKKQAQTAAQESDRIHYNALQQTFKILINSFYGYLGTSFSNFADPAAAAEITRRGREIVHGILDALRARGCKPIELDTDGVYFVPPPGQDGRAIVESIDLPDGIVLETDAEYPAMFSYKAKNYALLEKSGRVVIKGSGLKSRGIERILRDLLQEILTLLLTDRASEVPQLYERYLEQLQAGRDSIRALCRTETLSETPEQYRERVKRKQRNVSAPYELALLSGRKYQPGDQISYYVCGDARQVRVAESCKLAADWDHDENVVYYQQKVREMVERFLPYLPERARHLKRVSDSKAAQQLEWDLEEMWS